MPRYPLKPLMFGKFDRGFTLTCLFGGIGPAIRAKKRHANHPVRRLSGHFLGHISTHRQADWYNRPVNQRQRGGRHSGYAVMLCGIGKPVIAPQSGTLLLKENFRTKQSRNKNGGSGRHHPALSR